MKRNKFSLSHYKLATLNQGYLVPIGCFEVLPGDTIQQSTSALLRASPLVAPVMHPVHARIHHWFVPYRLLWDKWEAFITGGEDGFDDSEFPYCTAGPHLVGSLADYLGVPTDISVQQISALPFRAYAKIWNEFYRDQDLQADLVISTASGNDVTTNTVLQRVAWEKDYFTSARPWEQKGPQVTISLGGVAPVVPSGTGEPSFTVGGLASRLGSDGLDNAARWEGLPAADAAAVWLNPRLEANLAASTLIPINELREAFALQRYEEARARYGSRYSEYLAYLGVRSSDARLQRPEYLGGGKQTIQFSEVLQTAEGTSPVGEMRGHGIGAMRSNRYRRFFEEHGLVMSFLSVKPRTVYSQSLNRMWMRQTKEDFWQKELEHIGQQEVYNAEVYAATATPRGVFGYQDRYDEYRRQESTISGEFRTILDYWHMARNFSSAPVLNASFVASDPTNRVYASTDTHQIYAMCNHSIQARRMVARTGTSHIF